jgi:hypothetical protein
MERMSWRTRLSAAALWLVVLLAASPALAQRKDDAPSPEPMRYVRNIGPFLIDGHDFTVKLSVICYKDSPHAGMCNEDDQETVKWMKILDENGKERFSRSFTVAFAHQVERHVVEATLLEGREHQALEIKYERLPSAANAGESIQVFGVRDGTLKPLNEEPIHFYGELGELPAGTWKKNSSRLLADDSLPIYELTSYFYIVAPVRVNWKDFKLEQQETGEFEVAQKPPYRRRPDIMGDGFIHLYPSPDTSSTPAGVNVTPQTRVDVLKARFTSAPDRHSSASDTWLNIRIDGKEGWIVGVDDYTAVGLTFIK